MFNYFHKNRLMHDKKGQLAPVFILLLVLMIIMAMVTLNLSKVSSIKTDTANTADGGALAAGTTMANLFNSTTMTSAQSAKDYWGYYVGVSISFLLANYALTMATLSNSTASGLLTTARTLLLIAQGWASCENSPYIGGFCRGMKHLFCYWAVVVLGAAKGAFEAGKTAIKDYTSTMEAIFIGYNAYALSQWYWYRIVRESARKARIQARQMGYNIAFANSGIGGKLKPGLVPAVLAGAEDKYNYRNSYSDFMDSISEGDEDDPTDPPASLTYHWRDGQGRSHSVEVKTQIDETNVFEVIVMMNPFPSEFSGLLALIILGYVASAEFTAVGATTQTAIQSASQCNPPSAAQAPIAMAQGLSGGISALLGSIWAPLEIAWTGLLPNYIEPMRDPDAHEIEGLWVPIWIHDIEHDRIVNVETDQDHEGGDLVFWQTQYPRTYSYSVVNFDNSASMDPPDPSFDASVVETDVVGQATKAAQEEGGE